MSERKTALIIGAGPAGLTAAYKLLKTTDVKPIIVEKESFVGGISRTAEHNGNRIDIGGHRFFSKSDEVMSLWKEIMQVQGAPSYDDKMLGREIALESGGPDPEKEDNALLVRNRVSRIYYLRKFFDYPVSLKPQTFINMGFKRTVKAGFGYVHSMVIKRDENSLEDFMINRFGKTLYSMFFKNYTTKVWGREPKDISADWGAQRIKGLSLSKTVAAAIKKAFNGNKNGEVETSLIESFYYPKKGPGQLWETMLKDVIKLGGEIKYNTEVVGIDSDNNKINAVTVVCCGEKKQITADYYISTMPIKDLVGDMSENSGCSEEVRIIAENLPYRDFITVGLLVDKLKIKNTTKIKTLNNIVPDCWIYVQEDEVQMGRIQIFNNWSPYMLKNPENTVWIGLEYFCNEGDRMWNMSDSEFIDFAVNELASMNIIDKNDVKDSVRIKVAKAYPAYFGSYSKFDEVEKYLNTIDNLYCIGRNGQHRYNNMDHSMLTAIKAVDLIAGRCNDREELWKVNTEKEYHENKEK